MREPLFIHNIFFVCTNKKPKENWSSQNIKFMREDVQHTIFAENCCWFCWCCCCCCLFVDICYIECGSISLYLYRNKIIEWWRFIKRKNEKWYFNRIYRLEFCGSFVFFFFVNCSVLGLAETVEMRMNALYWISTRLFNIAATIHMGHRSM